MTTNSSLKSRKVILMDLNQCYKEIINNYKYINSLSKQGEEVISSAQWLLDNIYIVEKEYKEIKYNLPTEYLENIDIRIYEITKKYINNNLAVISEEDLEKLINKLDFDITVGELWAFPLILRIALIMLLKDITDSITLIQKQRLAAKKMAYEIIDDLKKVSSKEIVEKLEKKYPKVRELHEEDIGYEEKVNVTRSHDFKMHDGMFSVEFVDRIFLILKDNSVEDKSIYNFILDRLENNYKKEEIDNLIICENIRQGGIENTIGNIISAFRTVESIEWKQFFERTSKIELIFRADPANVYTKMDFESRDYYIHKVEELARLCKCSEVEVANETLELSKIYEGEEEWKKHIGYYLIDEGEKELLSKLNYSGIDKGNLNASVYVLLIVMFTITISVGVVASNYFFFRNTSVIRSILELVIIIIPSSEIAIVLLNWALSKNNSITHIPAIDLEKGIGIENRTVIIVPAIFSNTDRVKELLEELEVYYLGNRDDNIFFALLGDLNDSDSEEEEDDYKINQCGLNKVREINEKYFSKDRPQFFFLNRKRIFNEKENLFMGRERKRGKIEEFVNLIRNDDDYTFNIISDDISELKKCKYIITLDADTVLPMGAGIRLIGKMGHILNKAVVNNGKVVRGYGVMQPKVGVKLSSKFKTKFARIFAGDAGVDGYSTASFDLYQDLFSEGVFTGKGILNVDVFHEVVNVQIPRNRVLSHDLLEGALARCAMVSDIEIIEGYPAYYEASCQRLHRWVRGDWQVGRWIWDKNLSLLSRWKLFDNLRRSLLAPALLLAYITSLLFISKSSQIVILVYLISILPFIFTIVDFVVTPKNKIYGTIKSLTQVVIIFSFIPYQAYLMIDAIIRTIYRLNFSKKKLLQWTTAEEVEKRVVNSLGAYYLRMWISPFISILVLILSILNGGRLALICLPAVVLWIAAPAIAYSISKVIIVEKESISEKDEKFIKVLSRRVWAYYEDFVNKENNYLAPDNYQEIPYRGVAHRTSPTNIGMGLISNLIAYHMGYITIGEVCNRIEKTIGVLENLDKYKGHFFNWYDTVNCAPLWPKYVSTVDSGNLLGYLWMISYEMKEFKEYPIITSKDLLSLNDNYEILEELGFEEIEKISDVTLRNYRKILEDELEKVNVFLEVVINKENLSINKEEESNAISENDLGKYNGPIKKLREGKLNKKSIDKINEEIIYWLNKTKNDIEIKIEFFDDVFGGLEKLLINVLKDDEVLSLDELMKFLLDLMDASGENYKKILLVKLRKLQKYKDKTSELVNRIDKIIEEMDFRFLFNKERGLFTIGYNLEEKSLGNSYYDLLASEARATSFIAIARGQVPKSHWYKLSRNLTNAFNYKSLASWSGTMFEYFMPYQIMKCYENSIWDLTYKSVVDAQRVYCKEKHVPWGISESAYYIFDVDKNYQYKAFGVPKVGLKRGLEEEIVISPYSTIMTLPYIGHDAVANLYALKDYDAYGRYGFIEAIDYGNGDEDGKLVQCYMVHHLGMSFMALDNYLNDNILQNIFHSIPEIKAAELLLQERIPENVTYESPVDITSKKTKLITENFTPRIIEGLNEDLDVLILSNGSYSTMLSNLGTGYSKFYDKMVYRWKGDSTSDSNGMFFYIKNLNSNEYWSAAYEPAKVIGQNDYTIFYLDKAIYNKKVGSIESKYEVTLSSEDPVEIRKIILTNLGEKSRTIEVTSYMEVTLTTFEADIVHPGFSNLFISTNYENDVLLANRRPRSKKDSSPWAFSKVVTNEEIQGTITYETSRGNFVGRNRDLANPQAMDNDSQLNNTVGTVLDPIFSLRVSVNLKPGEVKEILFVTGVAGCKEEALSLGEKYSKIKVIKNLSGEFSYSTALELNYMGIKSVQGNLYQSLANYILYIISGRCDRENYISNIKYHQEDLWSFGISGDLPILFLKISNEEHIDILRQVINMHYYWRILNIPVDLVIYNEEVVSYDEPMQKSIVATINNSLEKDKFNVKGGIFLHNKATMNEEIVDFLIGISALVIDANKGTLANQFENYNEVKNKNYIRHKELNEEDRVVYLRKNNHEEYENKKYNKNVEKENNVDAIRGNKLIGDDINPKDELFFFNGYGGFHKDTNSYRIKLTNYENTPAPWINVISNEDFGFHISEVGSSYTWCRNSRENKITPWSNDWVIDPLSEALYIRDDGSGLYSSITPKPIRDGGLYDIEHGFGYSTFRHTALDISGESTYFCPREEKLKLCIVTLENKSSEDKGLTLFYYSQLVLGVYSYKSSKYITTDIEENFVCGQNPFSSYFGHLKTYLTITGGESLTFLGDRKEFIGIGRDLSNPKALNYDYLSNKVGSTLDPCLSVATKINIKASEKKKLVILFGCEENKDEITKLISKYSIAENAEIALEETKEYWAKLLGKIQINTPDKSMDFLINGWLMYQTYSCRYLARTAFYQSGGAYGFRDQLQDSLALGILNSDITRQQILRSASRQYIEGDVQHWWHPVVMSGIRTRFSDDLLWLPYVTNEYINRTGDYSILSEEVTYLIDEPLRQGEDERYTIVNTSTTKESIYNHCLRAINRALKFGEHNIPLMGSGDWNDGMSTVGNGGKGESVWLGWFIYSILDGFENICAYMKDTETVKSYADYKKFIIDNIEKNAWDGGWYRRAYFDDGTPLGSRDNEECKIDSLAQSWAVISRAAKNSRAIEAMEAVDKALVNEDKGLIMLLSPPFDNSKLEPGYIKGYVAGVRENGGQYTHAATWVIMAWTILGKGNKAWKYYNMINPINHSSNEISARNYKLEPYVMAADVYIREPHGGRGGWSWYTGASGWMYKVGIENILGLKQLWGKGYEINPCVPDSWNEYEINIKEDNEDDKLEEYHIVVKRKTIEERKENDNIAIYMNNEKLSSNFIPKKEGKNEILVKF